MGMSKRQFRTKQAIEAFQKCLECKSLPEDKNKSVQNELNIAQNRLQKQEDEVSI